MLRRRIPSVISTHVARGFLLGNRSGTLLRNVVVSAAAAPSETTTTSIASHAVTPLEELMESAPLEELMAEAALAAASGGDLALPDINAGGNNNNNGMSLVAKRAAPVVPAVVFHPFTGRLISALSPQVKLLETLGFQRDPTNALRLHLGVPEKLLDWETHPDSKKILKKGKSHWIKALRDIMMSSDDPNTILPDAAERVRRHVVQCYQNTVTSCMPPKLEALYDPLLEEIEMTVDQQTVLSLAMLGKSLYIGGSAGTGKTMLLKAINRELSQKHVRVAMTATTGVAAVQLGGCTFHHAFGAPIHDSKKWDVAALRAVDAVIIDEVSLLSAELLESFDSAAKIARLNHLPFGGLQVIACGDFLQLAVLEEHEKPCFQSVAFQQLISLQLVTPLRHRVDDSFHQVLSALRVGNLNADFLNAIGKKEIPPDVAAEATYLFPKRRNAQVINEQRLHTIEAPEKMFTPQRGPLVVMGSFTKTLLVQLHSTSSLIAQGSQATQHLQRGPSGAVVTTAQRLQEHTHRALRERHHFVTAMENIVVIPTRSGGDTTHEYLVRVRNVAKESPEMAQREMLKRGADEVLGVSALPVGTVGNRTLADTEWEVAMRESILPEVGGQISGIFDQDPASLIPLSVSMALADNNTDTVAPLNLKVGCRVMILRNLSRSVSNGSVGMVEAFSVPNRELFPRNGNRFQLLKNELTLFPLLPIVRLLSGEILQIPPVSESIGGTAETYYYGHDVYRLPLQLGYAFTVHKVQGLTLEGPVVLDCTDFFKCPHLIYVACSRVKREEQLYVKGLTHKKVAINKDAGAFAGSLMSAKLPLEQILRLTEGQPECSWVVKQNKQQEEVRHPEGKEQLDIPNVARENESSTVASDVTSPIA
jgi:ATP-dependent DNA helicase PIF1